jgi:hypothetical protein
MQFITTFDPSEVASLLVGGFPGEGPKLPERYRRLCIFSPLVYCEPRSVLFLPLGSSGSSLPPRASLRPLVVAGLVQKDLAQSRPLAWRKIDFSTVA